MTKFNIGDLIICNTNHFEYIQEGQIVEIINISTKTGWTGLTLIPGNLQHEYNPKYFILHRSSVSTYYDKAQS